MIQGLIIDKSNEPVESINENYLDELYSNEIEANSIVGDIKWPTNLSDPIKQSVPYQRIMQKLHENNRTCQRYPSDYTHGLMSQMTFSFDFDSQQQQESLTIGTESGWHIVETFCEPADGENKGALFKCMLFKHEAKRQLVLAHCETELNFLKDTFKKEESALSKNITGILCNQVVPQLMCCYEVTKQCIEMANDKYYLSFTGFGYGAWLAENSVYYSYKYFDFHRVKAVTFESPGLVRFEEDFRPSIINSNSHNQLALAELNIVTYLAMPCLMNTCNRHVGKVYRLFPDFQNNPSPNDNMSIRIKQIMEKCFSLLNKKFYQKLNDLRYLIDSMVLSNKVELLSSMLEKFDKETGKPTETEEVENWPNIQFKPKADYLKNVETLFKSPTNALINHIPVPKIVKLPIRYLVDFVLPRLSSMLIDKFTPNLTVLLSIFVELATNNDADLKHFYNKNYYEKLDSRESRVVSVLPNDDKSVKEVARDEFYAIFDAKYKTKRPNNTLVQIDPNKRDIFWFLKELSYLNLSSSSSSDHFSDVQLKLMNEIKESYVIKQKLKGETELIELEIKDDAFLRRNVSIESLGEQMVRLICLGEYKLLTLFNSKVVNLNTINVYCTVQEGACTIASYLPEVTLKNFVKRNYLTEKLDDTLSNQLKWAVLQGFGGAGKTTLAREYAHLVAMDTKSTWCVRWFNAEKKELVDKVYYDEFAECLRIKPEKNQDQQTFINLIHAKMEPLKERFLLVFDNLVNYADIECYISSLNRKKFQIIITTKDPKLFANIEQANVIKIESFSEKEAYEYIRLSMRDQANRLSGDESVRYFYENLTQNSNGIIPLKLKLAVSIFKENQSWSLNDFMDKINSKSNEETLSHLLIEPLKQSSSLELLRLLSFLDGSFISFAFIKELLNCRSKGKNGDKTLDASIEILNRKSLVEICYNQSSEYGVRVHDIIQSIVRTSFETEKERNQFLDSLIHVIKKMTPIISEIPDKKWSQMEKLHSQIIKIVSFKRSEKDGLEDVACLCESLSYYSMYALNLFDDALNYAMKSLEMREKLNALDAKCSTIESLNLIGYVYSNFGDHAKALDYFTRVADQIKSSKPLINLDVAKSLHNVGVAHQLLGEHNKALEFHLTALEIKKLHYRNAQDTDLARSLNIVGVTLGKLNEPENGVEYLQRAYEIRKSVYKTAVNHSDLVQSMNSLGIVSGLLGEHEKSLDYFRRAIEMSNKIYPANNPISANILQNLASVQIEMGKFEESLSSALESLGIIKQIYASGRHPEIAYALDAVGCAYSRLDDTDRALEYYLRALEMRRELFNGEDHADLALSYQSIAFVYGQQREREKQLDYHLRALQIRERIFKENHVDLATSLHNVASAYYLLGDELNALNYYLIALDMRKRILNRNNRTLADTFFNVAALYLKSANYESALCNGLEALEIMRNATSTTTDVLDCLMLVSLSYFYKSDYANGIEFSLNALNQLENILTGQTNAKHATILFVIAVEYGGLGERESCVTFGKRALVAQESLEQPNRTLIDSLVALISDKEKKPEVN